VSLEATISEISRDLQELAVTPHVRELRAKAVTYGRVIGNWTTYAPTQPQVQAMLECVAELGEKVAEAKREADRDVSRITRRQASEPMPYGKAAKKPGPPALPSGLPPALEWNASVPETGVRARSSRPSPRNEAPTRPPPALSGSASPPPTVPPLSAPRRVETPTPVPSLLRSRRSR
jgi:hypothetical protein